MKQNLRVGMIMWEVPPHVAGGTWTVGDHLVHGLQGRDVDVTAVVPWPADTVQSRPFDAPVEIVGLGMNRQNPNDPYDLTHHPYSASPRNGASDVDLGERLARICSKHAFDALHAHDWVTFAATQLAAQKADIPWVAHFHSIENERRSVSANSNIKAIERMACAEASCVVVPSRRTALAIQSAYGVPAERIRVVPNSYSNASKRRGNFDSKRIVFVGRLTAQKGPDTFVRVARAIRHRHPDASFEVFGSGEAREDLLAHTDIVTLRGALPWHERKVAFERASIVIVPSRAEPFGMVVLEAMESGVPVVYPAVAGVGEVVSGGLRVASMLSDDAREKVDLLLQERTCWEAVVVAQSEAIQAYAARDHCAPLLELWNQLSADAHRSRAQKRMAS